MPDMLLMMALVPNPGDEPIVEKLVLQPEDVADGHLTAQGAGRVRLAFHCAMDVKAAREIIDTAIKEGRA